MQYSPAPNTAFNSVHTLQPGHTLSLTNQSLTLNQFWSINLDDKSDFTYQQSKSSLRHVLQEAVDIRLESEVPIGSFLSGGTDSSIVVALMSQSMKDKVKTHCIGFDQKEFDESSYARIIADKFSTDHIETFVNIDIDKNIEKIIWHMDEPFSDASAIPTYLLCQETKKRVTVCLSGDGGDELFAGYNWYAELQRLQKIDQKVPVSMRKFLSKGLLKKLHMNYRGATFLKNIGEPLKNRHANLMSCFSDAHISTVLNDDIKEQVLLENPIEHLYDNLENSPLYNNDPVKISQWVDTQSYMSEDILMKVDKMSMAHSLEVRVPILDHHVVEFAFKEITNRKINGKNRKILLKDSASDLISKDFFERKKQGFSVPLREWLLNDLHDRVGDYLLSPNSGSSGVFNQKEVNKLWQQFKNNKTRIDLSQHIWTLLCFEMWHKEYITDR